MQSGDNRLEELYAKWLNKTATPQEKTALIELLLSGVSKEQLSTLIEKYWNELQDDNSFSVTQRQQLADAILKQWPASHMVSGEKRVPFFRRYWTAAAAVLLLIGTVFSWQLLTEKGTDQPKKEHIAVKSMETIAPGSEGAVLTLADGRQIVLDSAANGVIGTQSGAQISLQNNQVVYHTDTGDDISAVKELTYNTMVTPKGRQFQLVLPDGSKVWLNAASSIKYPVTFNNKERRVEITGEVYFEVAHDKSWPFIVQTKNQQVQALGTSFNVNAYDNEEIERTTLIEGSVRVSSVSNIPTTNRHSLSAVLGPGQQANVDNHHQLLSIAENQGEAAIAWKNGYFNLENIPFDRVMKQLERWYNIQVLYENGVPDLRFVGGLSRNMTLAALIRALQVSEVHFKMEDGRRLIVYK